MDAMLDNPYAPPTSPCEPRRGHGERLSVSFLATDETVLLRCIRACNASLAAEHIACCICLVIMMIGVGLTIWYRDGGYVAAGIGLGFIVGFAVRGIALRRRSLRVLRWTRWRINLPQGSPCQIHLTRTKLLLTSGSSRWSWPLRRIQTAWYRRFLSPTSYTVLKIEVDEELVVPVTSAAEFGDVAPDEFWRELRLRQESTSIRCRRCLWSWKLRRVRDWLHLRLVSSTG